MTSRSRKILICLSLLPALVAAGVAAQEAAKPEPLITLEEIVVEPASPAADTLCRLRVKLRNRGEKVGSQLGFEVRINDQELPVYGNQLFMYPVEPGTTAELQLYNFWSTETSRPMPADGKLRLRVALKEARWFDIGVDDEGVEVWTPVSYAEGLPVAKEIVLEMKR